MAQEQSALISMTDNDIIHALNIHGTFFERKCQEVVHNAKDWQIQETNYPVTYGGANSNLDIWAINGEGRGRRLVLPIECKKNNPDFIDWIFFRQPAYRPPDSYIQKIDPSDLRGSNVWVAKRELQRLAHDLTIADEARETKGSYQKNKSQDRTKTSNTAITDAATQVSIATQALMQQEYRVLGGGADINTPPEVQANPRPYVQLFIFPTIVTTAKLFTCEFQDADVDLATGEIAFDKTKLASCPYLIYNYPVPPALQLVPLALSLPYTHDTLKQLARMPIFIVQSEYFPTFLERLVYYKIEPKTNQYDNTSWYELHLKPEEFEIV